MGNVPDRNNALVTMATRKIKKFVNRFAKRNVKMENAPHQKPVHACSDTKLTLWIDTTAPPFVASRVKTEFVPSLKFALATEDMRR